jgi:hypothetical protein
MQRGADVKTRRTNPFIEAIRDAERERHAERMEQIRRLEEFAEMIVGIKPRPLRRRRNNER